MTAYLTPAAEQAHAAAWTAEDIAVADLNTDFMRARRHVRALAAEVRAEYEGEAS